MTGKDQDDVWVSVINSASGQQHLLKWGIRSIDVGRAKSGVRGSRVPFWTCLPWRYFYEPSKAVSQAGNWLY